jgi:hypothetical protein
MKRFLNLLTLTSGLNISLPMASRTCKDSVHLLTGGEASLQQMQTRTTIPLSSGNSPLLKREGI